MLQSKPGSLAQNFLQVFENLFNSKRASLISNLSLSEKASSWASWFCCDHHLIVASSISKPMDSHESKEIFL